MLIEVTEVEKELLSQTDLNIVQWINEHENEIYNLSISEIANATFTSASTVSRAIKKCGFSGIAEMRYKLSSQNNNIVDGKIVNQIMNNLLTECKDTIEGLEVDTIQQIIHHIKAAKRIYVIARGTTTPIARYFELQLHLLGYNVFVLEDSLLMQLSNKLFDKEDLVIIFSVKNSTPELAIAARHAKENNATVVTCCCVNGTLLKQYSDVYAYCRHKNTHVIEGFNIMSNLPLHLISRIIIDYLML